MHLSKKVKQPKSQTIFDRVKAHKIDLRLLENRQLILLQNKPKLIV